MNSTKKTLIVPVLLIAVGCGWLLTTLDVIPGINWVWTIGLGAVGILSFLLSGVDKFTIVTGPLFLLASVLSVLRQTGRLSLDVEIPILVISLGVLLLCGRSPAIPSPDWFLKDENPAS